MTRLNLKTTTALAVSLALAMPVHVSPVVAQEKEDDPFPCMALNDSVAENPNQLSREMIAFLTEEELPNADAEGQDTSAEVRDLPDCSADALAEAIDERGDELLPALAAAPEERIAEVMAILEEGESDLAVEAMIRAEAAIEAEATAEVDAEAVAEAAAEEAEAVAEAEADASAEVTTDLTSDADAALDATGDTVSDLADALSDATDAVTETVEDAAEAVTEGVEDATQAAETAVGEAGGQQLTDEERQAMQQAEAQAAAEAAAATAEADANAEAVAEVETETLSEEDVRSSTEEFDTTVATTSDSQPAVRDGKKKDKKRSNFENALLLGLGAVVVGSILKNGDQVVANSGDRVVVERNGELKVLKNDDELLRQPGAQIETRTFNDGSSRTIVSYEDGSQTITVRAADGRVLRRSIILPEDGREIVLFDDTREIEPVNFDELPEVQTARVDAEMTAADRVALEAALRNAVYTDVGRKFSLQQVRDFKRVRALAPMVELDAITFDTGSAAIRPSQAEALSDLGLAMLDIISEDPGAVFLVEGHTDAIGPASLNLALSDRRAETVALALTEYFGVPPQHLITQGYGETDLKIPTLEAERLNRRAAVRNITHLLR